MGRARRAVAAIALGMGLLPVAQGATAADPAERPTTEMRILPETRTAVGSSVIFTDTFEQGLGEATWRLRVPDQMRVDRAFEPDAGAYCSESWQVVSCVGIKPYNVVNIVVEMTAIDVGIDLPFSRTITVLGETQDRSVVEYDVITPELGAEVHPVAEVANSFIVATDAPFEVDGSVVSSGSAPIADAILELEVSAGLTLDAATWGSDQPCEVDGPRATCSIGDLEPWSTAPFSLEGTVSGTGDQRVTASVSSSTEQDSPDPHPDSIDVLVAVASEVVDLGLTLVDIDYGDAGRPIVGAPFSVTVEIENHSFERVFNISLAVLAEPGLDIVEPVNELWPCEVGDQSIRCQLGDRSPRAIGRRTFQLVPTVEQPLAFGLALRTTLHEPMPDPNSNVVLHRIPQPAPPSSDAVVVDNLVAGSAAVGQIHRFDVGFENAGPSRSTLTGTIRYPAGWTIISAEIPPPWGRPCEIVDRLVTCRFDGMRGGESTRFVRIDAIPSASGLDQPIVVAAETTTGSPAEPAVEEVLVDVGVVAGHFSGSLDLRGAEVRAYTPGSGLTPFATAEITSRSIYESFAFETLPTGTYQLVVVKPGDSSFAPRWLTPGTARRDDATPVILDGASTSVDLGRTPLSRGAWVDGRVTDETGAPVEGATVSVWPTDGQWVPYAYTTTDADGSYRISDVAAGDYHLLVSPPPGSDVLPRWFDGAPTRSDASALQLSSNTGERLSMVLPSDR